MHVLNKTWGIEIADPLNQQTGKRQNPTLKDQIKKAEEEPSRSTVKLHTHVQRPLTFKVVSMRLQGTLHNNTLKVNNNEWCCNLMRATHEVSNHHPH